MPGPNQQQPNYPLVEMAVDAIADWVTRYRNATRTGEDFQHCDPGEVRRVASELGMTPRQLHDLAGRGPGSADLLQKMLGALHVDAKAIRDRDPLLMRDLQRLCVTCANKTRCQHELASGGAAAHFHEFCPNAYTLDALLEEQKRPVS